jgi:glutamate-1-semialdehyde 2,1-aminomutase
MNSYSKSKGLAERAVKVAPGGVHTSLRRTEPLIIWDKAKGSKIYDVDGKEYIDYHLAFGPILLGHCHPKVDKAVAEQLGRGDLFGSGATEIEIEVAEKIIEHVPSAEMVLFCNSGSEATYHAVRVSRAIKKRKKVIKFEGCYHGWHDDLGASYLPPADKLGQPHPESAGALQETIEKMIIVPFNDIDAVEKAIKKNKNEIAAVILEPIMHDVGCILPKDGFLQALRELTEENDIFLIFDEVITGFRHHIGGVQKLFGVTPDITTMGKAIANGYPTAIVCGKEEIMKRFKTAEGGDVFFAGTFNAHPISMAACLATIKELESGKVHEHLFKLGEMLRKGLSKNVEELGLKAQVAGFGSIFVTYFTDKPISNYADLLSNDDRMFVSYRKRMIERGIFFIPFRLKRCHISASHTEEDIIKTIEADREVLSGLVRAY